MGRLCVVRNDDRKKRGEQRRKRFCSGRYAARPIFFKGSGATESQSL
jgi:hypothetical protein